MVLAASLVAQRVKHLPTMWETWVQSLGWEDPLGKEMATPSSTLAWKSRGGSILLGYSPGGCKESDMTEWLHFHFIQCLYFSFTYFTLYDTLEPQDFALIWSPGLCSYMKPQELASIASLTLTSYCSSLPVKMASCSPSRNTELSPLPGGPWLQLLSILALLFSQGPD